MLTLSKLLADNAGNHLSPREVDYAQTIYSSAIELRSVVDAILAQAMPEAGHSMHVSASSGDVVAIVEGDAALAAIMLERVRENGYQGFVAPHLQALRTLVRDTPPDAIILGMQLLDADGWAVLDVLKRDPETRQLPLCMISINGPMHRCLQISDPGLSSGQTPAALKSRRWRYGDVWRINGAEVSASGIGADLLDILRPLSPGGVALSDMTPIDLLQEIMLADYTADFSRNAPTLNTSGRLSIMYDDGYTELAILKQGSRLDEVLDDTTLFLHRAVSASARTTREGSPLLPGRALQGKKLLLIDNDIRSIYALTGVFEQQGMSVMHAESSDEVSSLLGSESGVDLVLIDVDMAEVDAKEVIGKIRDLEAFRDLPIIALTSGVARGDREKWIRLGATDDIAKPVNTEQLLSLLRAYATPLR